MVLLLSVVVSGVQVAQLCEETGGGGWVRTIPSDMESPASIDSLAKSVLEEHGGVDILVANAGTSLGGGDILKGDTKGWQSTVNINVLGPMRLTRLLTPHMMDNERGTVIFTGSLAGVRPTKTSAYGASKFAIRSWAEACYEVN
jgi:NADP-dependent 3-hydroxy acid dehydrogenase YdfG